MAPTGTFVPSRSAHGPFLPYSGPTSDLALHREDGWYVAQCPEVDVASQGLTIDEALANLAEPVELYLEEATRPGASLRHRS